MTSVSKTVLADGTSIPRVELHPTWHPRVGRVPMTFIYA